MQSHISPVQLDISSAPNSEKIYGILDDIKNRNSAFWAKKRNETSLSLFREASRRVSGYRDFLSGHKINRSKVSTWEEFEKLPTISKDNYLRAYDLKKISWDDSLLKPLIFTSTSGSTGEPFYFSRNHDVDTQSSVVHELFLLNGSFDQKLPTLVIVCFGMGVWIGGLITYQAFEILARNKKLPLSIITPGINKEEIFRILKNLAPKFSQILIAGYPPFIKDILDEAPRRDIDLKKYKLKLLFAAEAFTEKFRDHVCRLAGVENPLLDTMNIYGSADIGSMAFETPLSIFARRMAVKKKRLFKKIFGNIGKTPTFTQFIPSFVTFEAPNNEIVLTGDSSIPLVRYSIGDHGGVLTFNDLIEKFSLEGFDLIKEARDAGIEEYMYQLPFVYVYERIDLSTTIYGLQVYPETIREVLIDEPFDKFLTGKIVLTTKFDRKQNQYIEINIEMQKGQKINLIMKNKLLKKIVANLKEKSSEFKELSRYLGKRVNPRLVFWNYENPEYFKAGIKQKWIKK